MRRMNESGVATVVGAILVLAAVVSFLVVYNVQWVPTFVENREAETSAALQASLVDWGSTAENLIANGFANRSLAATLPVGATTGAFTGSHRSTGTGTIETLPSMTVFRNATQVAHVTGALRVDAAFSRYPAQSMRYAFGALEISQAGSAWVDLRGLVAAQRAGGGTLSVGLQVVGISGGPQTQGGGTTLDVVAVVESASSASSAAGTVRLLVENVQADAWRAAFTRVLSASSLVGETAANCSASAQNWCFDVATNTPTTVDLYLRNVGGGWTTTWGTLRAELRV